VSSNDEKKEKKEKVKLARVEVNKMSDQALKQSVWGSLILYFANGFNDKLLDSGDEVPTEEQVFALLRIKPEKRTEDDIKELSKFLRTTNFFKTLKVNKKDIEMIIDGCS
jgi:hypothetical protein